MANAVIFGAGRVGRGLLAEIYQQAGYRITFVDSNMELVERINRRRAYTIHKARGALTSKVQIGEVSALHIAHGGAIVDALCAKEVSVAIAVSPFSLDDIASILAVAIARRALEWPDQPFDILLCDNSADPQARLRSLLANLLGGAALAYLEQNVGFVRTIVMRMSAENPPCVEELGILNDGYPEMPVDASAFKAAMPQSPILRATANFNAESTRKIYTVNMVEAAMAYLGAPLGFSTGAQCILHPRIRPVLTQALEEAAHGLCHEHGFARRQMDEWNAEVLQSLENPALDASLRRLGVDACRKVGSKERLVGPAALCLKYDRQPHALARAIAYAYLYVADDPGTKRLRVAVQEEGIEYALERFSAIDYRHPLRALVLDEYERALSLVEER